MNTPQEVAKTIKCLLNSQSRTVTELTESCGLSKNALSSMQSAGYLPRTENLAKIADYLGVSVDFLLGRKSCASELTENEAAIVAVFKNLTETQQGELIGRAKLMAEQNAEEVLRKESAS